MPGMDHDPIECPRCGTEMETRIRSGVTIDLCLDCYGIFLDRGEFERLMGMEAGALGTLVPFAASSARETD